MVSLIRKFVKGHLYWYAAKSARVRGKPRIVWQKYLGSADHITESMTQSHKTRDLMIESMPLGHVAALARANEDLHFIDIVDKHTNKKSTDGLSVGQYILLQIMGRAEGALSRDAIADWYPGSVTKLLMNTPHKMNAKNLIRHLDYPTTDAIRSIEDDLARRLLDLGLTPTKLLWDTTNVFTRIDSGGDIPQKGHSKEHRNDRNLIGIGLAVSSENIPFFHETFEANNHDSKVFSDVIDVIVDRLKKINADAEKVVMIIDKGNNSDDNIKALIKKAHVIGTIRSDQAEEYLRVPLKSFEPIYKNGGEDELLAYRTKGTHYGEEFTIVATYNPRTQRKQQAKYEESKAKILTELADLKNRVENNRGRGRPWTQNRAIRAIVDIIPMHMRSVFNYDVVKKVGRGGGLIMSFGINEKKEMIRYSSFGKIIHFTDLHDWSSKEISESYNSKYQIEDDFRWLKDKLMIPIKPIYVRTDPHIRSHVFICVMGLLFYRYIQWKLRRNGREYSTQELANILDGIRLSIVKNGSDTKGKFVVEKMDRLEAHVFSALDMSEFIKA
jgi:transposase